MSPRGIAIRVVAPVLVLAVATAARALGQDPEQLRAELVRTQREAEQRGSELTQLLDARIRHDLGLPPAGQPELLRADQPATSTQLHGAEGELAAENAATSALAAQVQDLERRVAERRQQAAARALAQRQQEEWLTVPAPGAQLPVPTPAARPDGETAAAVPRADGGGRQAQPLRVVPNLPPVQAQIQGSEDHPLVARALLRAAQALVDRADVMQSQGHPEAAADLDEQARQRLLRAVEELRDATAGEGASLPDLFHLGKCKELLFRVAERRDGLSVRTNAAEYQRREQEVRDVFLRITARDVVVKDRTEQLGEWGRAAQTAMEHFRWMNLHGTFVPRTALESIAWPSRQ